MVGKITCFALITITNTVERRFYGHPWDLAQLFVILRCLLYWKSIFNVHQWTLYGSEKDIPWES